MSLVEKINSPAGMKLANFGLFQAGWFACILGGDMLAMATTTLILVLHGCYFVRHPREWFLIGAFSFAGISFDSTLFLLDVYKSDYVVAPAWLMCLWLLFSTTLFHSLAWLQSKPLIGGVIAAIFAPLSYWAGMQFVPISFFNNAIGFSLLAVFWALLFPLGLCAARKFCIDNKQHGV